MTDAVDKVGDEQRAGNNRIQMPSFLNRYCAPDSYLDSMLLIRPSKNVYRQHRSKADMTPTTANVGFVPCVDGSRLASQNFTSQRWSVQPCVRPVDAVHMTAGHNALRGSGPGQKPAFDDALAHVGCPDRRIDRLCITCCSPSQPSHHAGCCLLYTSPSPRDGFLVALALGHHGPGHSRNLVGKRDGGNLGRLSRQQRREPGPMPGAMDLGIADDSQCSGHEQAAQIAIT